MDADGITHSKLGRLPLQVKSDTSAVGPYATWTFSSPHFWTATIHTDSPNGSKKGQVFTFYREGVNESSVKQKDQNLDDIIREGRGEHEGGAEYEGGAEGAGCAVIM